MLYDNLKSKDRIFLKKRVIDVAATSAGVSVQTQDGDTFAGDIVVGADGIHSTVRKEMWRIADEVHPGFFPEDELKRKTINECLLPLSLTLIFQVFQSNIVLFLESPSHKAVFHQRL